MGVLQIRLEQMEKDRDVARERAEKDKAEQAAKQQEHDDTLAAMCSQLEVLQATMITLQEDSNRKFAEMQQQQQQQQQIQHQQQQIASDQKFADMQAMMLKFINKMEGKHQLQAHGKGSSKAGAPQQKREVDVETAELDADGHPKKLKVPFDCLQESAAAASASC